MKKSTPFATRVFISVIVCIFVISGLFLWWRNGIMSVDLEDTKPVVFVVDRNESIRSISTRLAQERLIRSPSVFFLLIKSMGIEKQIQAGDFRLNRSMSARSIAQELTRGMLDVWITTLEGWRAEEIAMELSKELNIPEQEFLRVAKEGYLFPDTYLIPKDSSASAVVRLFENTFDQKVPNNLREKIKALNISFNDAIILASIVEREGKSDEDKPIIAGILLRRLEAGWPLQVDATLQYALGYQSQEKSWWKKELTNEDKTINSPFNTYTNLGLPPSPICNPGLSSINAVINAVKTDYWYYLHDKQGLAKYARTDQEHEENILKYLR